MPADHLVGDRGGDRVEIEFLFLVGHLGVEHDLEQQVAELVLERRHVLALDRVRDLVGLFDGVGGDGGEALLEVPGAAAIGIAQLLHDGEQAFHGVCGQLFGSHLRCVLHRGLGLG